MFSSLLTVLWTLLQMALVWVLLPIGAVIYLLLKIRLSTCALIYKLFFFFFYIVCCMGGSCCQYNLMSTGCSREDAHCIPHKSTMKQHTDWFMGCTMGVSSCLCQNSFVRDRPHPKKHKGYKKRLTLLCVLESSDFYT